MDQERIWNDPPDRTVAAVTMKHQFTVIIASGALILTALYRGLLWPDAGFYLDVPRQLACMDTGTFHVQFPGYVPYHLLICGISMTGLSLWTSMQLVSAACVFGSFVYLVRIASTVSTGLAAATGLAAITGLLPAYFGVVGASYACDMLCMSALLYHGIQYLQRPDALRFRAILGWFCLGFVMRPLSFAWTLPGLFYLARTRKRVAADTARVILAAAIAVFILIGLSAPYYGSPHSYLASASQVLQNIAYFGKVQIATNCFRFLCYPVYFFQAWLVFAGILFFRHRNACNRKACIFLAMLALPYLLLLLKYLANPGYLCLLWPVVLAAPACVELPKVTRAAYLRRVVPAFLLIAAIQLFIARPVPTTGLVSAVANAYFLNYSRSGLMNEEFDTLSSILLRHGMREGEIPEGRKKHIREEFQRRGRPID